MGYQIYKTYAKFFEYSRSLSLPFLPTVSVVSITSFLVPIIGVEVAKIDSSFLAYILDFIDTYLSNVFFDGKWRA